MNIHFSAIFSANTAFLEMDDYTKKNVETNHPSNNNAGIHLIMKNKNIYF